MNREIKNISVDDMMTLICKSYNDMFHEEYVGTKSVLKYDLGDIDGKEYIESQSCLQTNRIKCLDIFSKELKKMLHIVQT